MPTLIFRTLPEITFPAEEFNFTTYHVCATSHESPLCFASNFPADGSEGFISGKIATPWRITTPVDQNKAPQGMVYVSHTLYKPCTDSVQEVISSSKVWIHKKKARTALFGSKIKFQLDFKFKLEFWGRWQGGGRGQRKKREKLRSGGGV